MFKMPDRKMIQLPMDLYEELADCKRRLQVELGRDLTFADTIREALKALRDSKSRSSK